MRFQTKAKKSKYRSRKVERDGIIFDSVKEANRWRELTLLEKAGEITDLQRQVEFVLIPDQREPDTIGKRGGIKKGKIIERKCSYVADFIYKDREGKTHVEDVKGYKEGGAYRVFVIKRKLMYCVYGVRIEEV